jgi:hypothetical protein
MSDGGFDESGPGVFLGVASMRALSAGWLSLEPVRWQVPGRNEE